VGSNPTLSAISSLRSSLASRLCSGQPRHRCAAPRAGSNPTLSAVLRSFRAHLPSESLGELRLARPVLAKDGVSLSLGEGGPMARHLSSSVAGIKALPFANLGFLALALRSTRPRPRPRLVGALICRRVTVPAWCLSRQRAEPSTLVDRRRATRVRRCVCRRARAPSRPAPEQGRLYSRPPVRCSCRLLSITGWSPRFSSTIEPCTLSRVMFEYAEARPRPWPFLSICSCSTVNG
jgi:hypothetical protein